MCMCEFQLSEELCEVLLNNFSLEVCMLLIYSEIVNWQGGQVKIYHC